MKELLLLDLKSETANESKLGKSITLNQVVNIV